MQMKDVTVLAVGAFPVVKKLKHAHVLLHAIVIPAEVVPDRRPNLKKNNMYIYGVYM